jgi:hypothetical protein
VRYSTSFAFSIIVEISSFSLCCYTTVFTGILLLA